MQQKIHLPENVNTIICQLEAAGYEAYVVGGCVRDSLLGRKPDDWDITTSATPEQVKRVFRRTIDTGIQHGTVTVMIAGEGYEVTTYRIDGEYEDSRHPKAVIFTANLTEDLKRRDFTINAMAYNERSGLVDAFGGMEDLHSGIVRCVGSPKERFGEDALRMMRAVRFSAQLGFTIEQQTQQAIASLASMLVHISAERIQTELVKLLLSPHPEQIRLAYQLGITKIIMPELDAAFATTQNNPHHIYTVGEHIIYCLEQVGADKALRIAALLHDIGKPAAKTTDEQGIDHFYQHEEIGMQMAEQILKRLKFDNDTLNKVKRYIQFHDYDCEPTPRAVRRAIHKIGEAYFAQVLELKRADTLAQSLYQREEKLARISQVEEIYQEILEQNQCVSLKTMQISGDDLLAIGIPAGRQIGRILQALLEDVLENPEHNNYPYLLEAAKQQKFL